MKKNLIQLFGRGSFDTTHLPAGAEDCSFPDTRILAPGGWFGIDYWNLLPLVDVGCGNNSMLSLENKWWRRKGFKNILVGVDPNLSDFPIKNQVVGISGWAEDFSERIKQEYGDCNVLTVFLDDDVIDGEDATKLAQAIRMICGSRGRYLAISSESVSYAARRVFPKPGIVEIKTIYRDAFFFG